MQQQHQAYHQSVWNSYIEKGGDQSVVIYGFVELLLETKAPTSLIMKTYILNILNNISLKNEMLKASN